MKITKLGHCCLVIEEKGKRILTDPGSYTTAQNELTNIDIVLISHEHQDHFHVESLKIILKNNTQATVVTNASVGAHLTKEGIAFEQVGDKDRVEVKGITFEGYGTQHIEIYKDIGQVENTSYSIENTLYYPGDAFYNPQIPVDILLLPVAGPWCRIKDAIEYALAVKPRVAIPVHDGGLTSPGITHRTPERVLTQEGITFLALEVGKETVV